MGFQLQSWSAKIRSPSQHSWLPCFLHLKLDLQRNIYPPLIQLISRQSIKNIHNIKKKHVMEKTSIKANGDVLIVTLTKDNTWMKMVLDVLWTINWFCISFQIQAPQLKLDKWSTKFTGWLKMESNASWLLKNHKDKIVFNHLQASCILKTWLPPLNVPLTSQQHLLWIKLAMTGKLSPVLRAQTLKSSELNM